MAKKRKVGRPKGKGGRQPNWKFTKKRRGNIKKARKVITAARNKAGVAIITSANVGLVKSNLPPKSKKKKKR